MKTKEELNALKKEFMTLNSKLKELTGNELQFVLGANSVSDENAYPIHCDYKERGVCGYPHRGECERILSGRYTC